MKLCKHQPNKVFTHILDPKFSTDDVLIDVDRISQKIEHYILRFKNPGSQKKYGWFYLSGKDIRNSKRQPNGRGEVYVVSMGKRKAFEPDNNCNCSNAEFAYDY